MHTGEIHFSPLRDAQFGNAVTTALTLRERELKYERQTMNCLANLNALPLPSNRPATPVEL
jgi:hypothetical protein